MRRTDHVPSCHSSINIHTHASTTKAPYNTCCYQIHRLVDTSGSPKSPHTRKAFAQRQRGPLADRQKASTQHRVEGCVASTTTCPLPGLSCTSPACTLSYPMSWLCMRCLVMRNLLQAMTCSMDRHSHRCRMSQLMPHNRPLAGFHSDRVLQWLCRCV